MEDELNLALKDTLQGLFDKGWTMGAIASGHAISPTMRAELHESFGIDGDVVLVALVKP